MPIILVRSYQRGIRAMTTYKDCIEKLEADMLEVKESIQRLHQTTERLSKTTESIECTLKELSTNSAKQQTLPNPLARLNGIRRRRLEILPILGRDTTVITVGMVIIPNLLRWIFLGSQGTIPLRGLIKLLNSESQQTEDGQKVTLAAFYLEGEANQWWQWLKKG